MSKYPLLPMPPSTPGEPPRKPPPPRNRFELTPAKQQSRLGKRFEHLEKILAKDGEGLSLREDPSSIAPERALVMEVAGSIENFQSLVSRIDGLEYLADQDSEFEPTEDFAPLDTRRGREGELRLDNPISGKVYIAMPDVQALNELLQLWRIWQSGNDFPWGRTAWRTIFESLRDIRPWGIGDRIDDDAIAFWESELPSELRSMKRIEVELWYFHSLRKRGVAYQEFLHRVEEVGGGVIDHKVIDEIRYDGVLIDVPPTELRGLMQRRNTRLATCDSIMYICPQSVVDIGQYSEESAEKSSEISLPNPEESPVVALFDSVPIQRHDQLIDRIAFDDPDNLETLSVGGARNHATEMASLIIHGDLNLKENPISRTLYVRPIMYSPKGQSNDVAVEDHLFVDTVHRAVVRMKEGDTENPPAAPSVFIVNFSIGIKTRPFSGHMSPLARLLDYLAEHYNILFLVSAGNISDPLELNGVATWTEFEDAAPEERERIVLRALNESKALRALLSPAEALNVITVGSWHEDHTRSIPDTTLVVPFREGGFSNVSSRLGLGYRRVIKPDIHMPGGRESLMFKSSISSSLQVLPRVTGCGLSCATGDPSASGLLNRVGLVSGTSASTALATHAAHQIFEVITDKDNGLLYSNIDPEFYAVVIKSLLAHRARWTNRVEEFESLFGPMGVGKHVQRRDNIARFVGFGLAQVEESHSCSPHRATLVGYGKIFAKHVDVHRIPLPMCLSNSAAYRALTVTVAWISPVNFRHQTYRRAKLEVQVAPVDELDRTVGVRRVKIQPSDKSVPRGTVFHCRYEGSRAVSFVDDGYVSLSIICRPQAGGLDEGIRYGIAISIEASEGVPVYQEVRSRLAVPVVPRRIRSTEG